MLEFKEALDAFENTTKMVLLRSFAPPGSMEVTDPDADTKQQLDATIAKLDDGLEYSRAATMSILVDVFGRDQVDSVFGKTTVDTWLEIAQRPFDPHGGPRSSGLAPKL